MGNRKPIGAVIVEEVINNMRAGAERLYYTVQVPTVYHVYVHPYDYNKLLPIENKIIAETKRALGEELAARNGHGANGWQSLRDNVRRIGRTLQSFFGRPTVSPGAALRYEKGGGDWQINLYPDTTNGLKAGDVVIESELILAAEVEPSSGVLTKAVRTVRLDGVTNSVEVKNDYASPWGESSEATKPQAAARKNITPPSAFALISYKDGRGDRHDYLMRKVRLNVGKGGESDTPPGCSVDLALDSDVGISPLHLQLLFDPVSRKFFIKDLSAEGTRVNGRLLKSSVGRRDGRTIDLDVTEELPPAARISLANKIILDFKSLMTH